MSIIQISPEFWNEIIFFVEFRTAQRRRGFCLLIKIPSDKVVYVRKI